jgi:hypothetical protein
MSCERRKFDLALGLFGRNCDSTRLQYRTDVDGIGKRLNVSSIEFKLIFQVWGTSFGTPRTMSGANSLANFGGQSNATSIAGDFGSPNLAVANGAHFTRSQGSIVTGRIEKGMRVDEKAVEEEEIEDPERVVIGHSKRPMILTHTVIVGVTLAILLALESVVLSKVSNNSHGSNDIHGH